MAKAKKKVSKIKIKKKIWYKVIAPKIFANKEVGESYLQSPDVAVGRKLKVNLKDLTGNIKDQNVQIGLQITNVEGNLLKTSLISYRLTSQYVKRCIRKNCVRLDDYFLLKTKGGKNVVIKSLMVTINKAQRSVRSKLRKELQELLEAEVTKRDMATFVSLLVNRRIQMEIKKKLKKILPLKEMSIRVLELQEKGLVTEEIVVNDKSEAAKVEEKVAEKVEEKVAEEVKEEIKDTIPSSPETKTEDAKEEAAEKIAEEVKEKVEEVAEEIAEKVKEGE
jgi:ribosomal protein S3AE